jgi:stress response protein SCP2
MVLIAYTIKESENDDDIHAFECQTRGKILSTLDIIFYNVGSYNVSINQT